MKTRFPTLLVAMGLLLLPPLLARADEASDKKAEIQRKKEEAKQRALDKKAAAKAEADKAAADKAAADKAAADKAAADKAKAGTGGSGSGGASGSGGTTSAAGGATTKASGGAAGAGGAASTTKVVEKDAPLPAGDIETLRKDRVERRKLSVERLRKRWGSLLASDKGAADLKQHSRRVALLQRARVVAEAKKDKTSVELVDVLLTQEDDRHSAAMNALREGALK